MVWNPTTYSLSSSIKHLDLIFAFPIKHMYVAFGEISAVLDSSFDNSTFILAKMLSLTLVTFLRGTILSQILSGGAKPLIFIQTESERTSTGSLPSTKKGNTTNRKRGSRCSLPTSLLLNEIDKALMFLFISIISKTIAHIHNNTQK